MVVPRSNGTEDASPYRGIGLDLPPPECRSTSHHMPGDASNMILAPNPGEISEQTAEFIGKP